MFSLLLVLPSREQCFNYKLVPLWESFFTSLQKNSGGSVLFVRVLCASAVRVGVCGGSVCLGALRFRPAAQPAPLGPAGQQVGFRLTCSVLALCAVCACCAVFLLVLKKNSGRPCRIEHEFT